MFPRTHACNLPISMRTRIRGVFEQWANGIQEESGGVPTHPRKAEEEKPRDYARRPFLFVIRTNDPVVIEQDQQEKG